MGKKLFLLIALIAIAALFAVNVYLGKGSTRKTAINEPIIPPVEASQSDSLSSPDGKQTLVVKRTKVSGGTVYSFTVSGKEIFAKTVDKSITITIPYNAWSPDGKYLFLKETGNAGDVFFALSASVSSSDQNDQTASISDLFVKKYPDLKIEDVTGWGGMNLIVINSLKSDGSRGPSFWFEMPSHALIQLSTLF